VRVCCLCRQPTFESGSDLSRGDAQVIAVGIEEAEVAQSPGLEGQVGCERPAGGNDSIAFECDVVDLQYELDSGWDGAMRRIDRLPGAHCADAHIGALHGEVRYIVLTMIVHDRKPEHADVEVRKDIEIGWE
jgi:hypothetical protein